MAIAPDSGDLFVREVDENLRRDQATAFAKRYGGWIVAAVLLFLGAVGGWLYWQDRQRTAAEQEGEQLSQVMEDIATGNSRTAPQRLDSLAKARSDGYRAAALLTRAALDLQQNDRASAIKRYAAIAADDGLPNPYRQAATLRGTALAFDDLAPQQVIARLEPLAKPGGPWFGSAGEMTALAMLKMGRKDEAGRLFAAIATDRRAPATIRERAAQIATTLGIDAVALLERTAP